MGDFELMKNCPMCLKEVPAHWSVCEFCGNVFDRREKEIEHSGMLFWSASGAKASKSGRGR